MLHFPLTQQSLASAVLLRAQQNLHPLREVNLTDIKESYSELVNINTADDWASYWLKLADKYIQLGRRFQMQSDKANVVNALQMALRYCYLARWPVPNSAKKQLAYEMLKSTFLSLGALLPEPIETLLIPYKDQHIKAFLRRPQRVELTPLMIHWGGIDTWKEDLTHLSNTYLQKGWATLVIDMPGTGESPEKVSLHSHRIFSAVLDYIYTRKDFNLSKIAVQGSSWGGYWATKLALTEPLRIKAAVNWGGPIHAFFDPSWQQRALKSSEYLLDIDDAVFALYGTDRFDDYLKRNQEMSLKTQLENTESRVKLLYVNGEKDSLVPFEEIAFLNKSRLAMDTWTNPEGIHMGISKGIDHRYIMGKIILPWLTDVFNEV